MKKFRFKLEALLRMRRIEEERALGDLAKVMVRVNEQENVRTAAFQMLKEEMDRFDADYKENFDITLWQIYDRYLERLNAEAADAAVKLEEIRPEMETEMAKVMEARRARRIVEILKERELEKYNGQRRKHERQELEEANRRSKLNVGGMTPGATYDTGPLAPLFTGPAAGLGQPPDAKYPSADAEQSDHVDTDGTTESEVPTPEPDHVADYFKRMGLGEPPPGFGK
ncbi:MAG: flagellar export protein FliJ [bacterium]|nr:flagellar export protein FliJ [bacterium]